MPSINELDSRVMAALNGPEKLKALLRSRGLRLTDFAKKYNHWVSTVSECIWGKYPHVEIRDDLATELGLSREDIDRLIDEEAAA